MNARVLLTLTFLVSCTAAAAADAPPSPARHELPYNDCLRTDRINEWSVVDDRTVTVRNGPNHFLVKTTVNCPRMTQGGGLRFRTSNSDRAMGGMRICGGINEKIMRRSEPACPVESIKPISKAAFVALEKKAKRHGSGAEPNGTAP